MTRGADRTAQIGLVSAADGSLRVLKFVDWGRERPSKMAFSPDGKFLAYDIPTRSGSQQRDIYLLAVDGSHEAPVAVHPAHDRVLGWAPDGGHLLFASDRSGAHALWAGAIAGGSPQGAPELIKSDTDPRPVAVTACGSPRRRRPSCGSTSCRGSLAASSIPIWMLGPP